MYKAQIGENAGVIWRKLESKGKLNLEELQEETGLDLVEMLTALGWLARENKISISKDKGVTSISLYQETYY
jgi:hypothetical protein